MKNCCGGNGWMTKGETNAFSRTINYVIKRSTADVENRPKENCVVIRDDIYS